MKGFNTNASILVPAPNCVLLNILNFDSQEIVGPWKLNSYVQCNTQKIWGKKLFSKKLNGKKNCSLKY